MSNFLPLMIRHILEGMQWTPHEISVYSILLQKGAMGLSRIAVETNLGVSSVQYALRSLHMRKMVTKFLFNAQPRWKAQKPEALHRWYKGQAKQYTMHEAALQQFATQYDFDPESNTPHVVFHEGTKAVKRSLQEIAERCVSKQIDVVAFLQQDVNEELLHFLQEGCASLRARGIAVRVLAAGGKVLAGPGVCRLDGAQCPKAMRFAEGVSALLLLVDGKVYAMHCERLGPCSVLIEYPHMAEMIGSMFERIYTEYP